jgi:hypothetical protein
MYEVLAMEFVQRAGQRQAQIKAFAEREAFAAGDVLGERLWGVAGGMNALPGHLVVAQLHHVIKPSLVLVDTHVQHIHETLVAARNRLETPDARQLALERLPALE